MFKYFPERHEKIAFDTGSEIAIEQVLRANDDVGVHLMTDDRIPFEDVLGPADDEIGNACRFAAKRIAQIDRLYNEIGSALDTICCDAMRNKDFETCQRLVAQLPDRSFHKTELVQFLRCSGQLIRRK
ncbi:hypothetical protein PHIN3_252 [Sinorhizobium phage phiN3]|uniref:Uncharacterized protein n=1 Tax=Sinorhizobium phage phiN3 TaxID=1647405 RepID=A0A0F6WCN8_9CAUD|nr:hypothetical protein AVT40_gp281 [Sinorhizobium phage phiN3]AKF13515.1 hypothetical protein PHIN3_252 [Sinorhizobium phage phiN3]